jgi:SAM-dependent methyltransferase
VTADAPPAASLPAAFFEEFYRQDPDPWGFATSPYERDKYAATLAALPAPRYARAFEVGCSIGVLSRQLAERCDSLLSIDAAEAPLAAARQRCADAPHVAIRRARVPEDWPEGESFDLILLSEVLYYFDPADLAVVAARVLGALRPGGDVVLVHWLPVAEPPYPQTGDAAVQGFLAAAGAGLRPLAARREPLYRLDVLRRA